MRRFSQPQYPWPQELHDSRGAVLLRAGAVAPPFSVRRNRLMPFRAPALAQVSRPRPRLHPTAAKYRHNGGSPRGPAVEAEGHRQDGRRQKTSARQAADSTRMTGGAEGASARQAIGSAGATVPRVKTIRAASEPPAARRTSAKFRLWSEQREASPESQPTTRQSVRSPRGSLGAFGRARRVQGRPSSQNPPRVPKKLLRAFGRARRV